MRALALVLAAGASFPAMARPLPAQDSPVQRGSWTVAGTAQFAHFRDIGNDDGSTHLEIAPRLGYFVVPGLALNANLQFQRISSETQRLTGWGAGPGLTYYFSGVSRRAFPFLSGRTLFTWSNADITLPPVTGTDERSDWSWLVSAGMLIMLGEHVGLSGEAYYQRSRFTAKFSTQPGESVNRAEQYGLQWGIAAFIF